MKVRAQVLGPPTVEVDGRRHDPPPGKRGALLYYLVWRDAWASRDEVAALLWGDRSDRVARANLRQTLFQLRASPLGSALDVERERLRYRGDSDLARLRRALRERDVATALRACAGAFLDGWRLPHAPQADAWIERTRSDLAATMRRAAARHAAELETAGDLLGAADLYGAIWREDVLDDGALAAQLRLLRSAGRGEDAARTAADFRAAFLDAMDMEPDGPLAELLRDAERAPRTGTRSGAPSPRPAERLPSSTTSFVGRTRELEALRAWRASPSSRLVTLLGLGGVGKTRLPSLGAVPRGLRPARRASRGRGSGGAPGADPQRFAPARGRPVRAAPPRAAPRARARRSAPGALVGGARTPRRALSAAPRGRRSGPAPQVRKPCRRRDDAGGRRQRPRGAAVGGTSRPAARVPARLPGVRAAREELPAGARPAAHARARGAQRRTGRRGS